MSLVPKKPAKEHKNEVMPGLEGTLWKSVSYMRNGTEVWRWQKYIKTDTSVSYRIEAMKNIYGAPTGDNVKAVRSRRKRVFRKKSFGSFRKRSRKTLRSFGRSFGSLRSRTLRSFKRS
jgi:hypothetical protein